MTHRVARALAFCLFLALGVGLLTPPLIGGGFRSFLSAASTNRAEGAARTVYLAGGLSAEQLLAYSANLAASGQPGALLIDSEKLTPSHKLFLEKLRAECIVSFGEFRESSRKIEQRLGTPLATLPAEPGIETDGDDSAWKLFFEEAERVVVAPAMPYRQLMQAACLAGALHAPLYIVHGGGMNEAEEFRRQAGNWKTSTIYAVGNSPRLWRGLPNIRVIRLANEKAVAASVLRHQLKQGAVKTLVVANPCDWERKGAMSPLAPWLTIQKHGILLLTNAEGNNVNEIVRDAVQQTALAQIDNVILLADLKAIPMEQRPNTIPNTKDAFIEMEPLTPVGMEPFSFAVGRLFHEDPGVVALMLARERLLSPEPNSKGTYHALVASNAGGSLPLLETFSRNTAQELRNRGYETETLFGHEVNRTDVRRRLPQQDIFLWEGHHNTLIQDYEFPKWTEPLQPSLMFVQSCLALKDDKVQPLLERGALCVVGSPTRIFSASGGAFSLSFFDALLYEQQSLGGSLRHAKNFLLTYAMLKEKRLGKDAKLTAANLRSAWAFTLWGDPTLRLPLPAPPEDALPPVRHEVAGNSIILRLPETPLDKTSTRKYRAQIPPNGRLAGLIARDLNDEQQPLVPFVFAEVSLPKAPAGKVPRLTSRLPSSRWAFCWDARRRCGYLLAMPRAGDREELRFHVTWESELASR